MRLLLLRPEPCRFDAVRRDRMLSSGNSNVHYLYLFSSGMFPNSFHRDVHILEPKKSFRIYLAFRVSTVRQLDPPSYCEEGRIEFVVGFE
jgi:hypothetical protein